MLFPMILSQSLVASTKQPIDVPGRSAYFVWKVGFEDFSVKLFLSLSPSFECVHTGIASWKLMDLFQGRLWQKAEKKEEKKLYVNLTLGLLPPC